MAFLQEGEPLLPTSGAAAVWNSWCRPAPSCLEGSTAAGEVHQLGPATSVPSATSRNQAAALNYSRKKKKKIQREKLLVWWWKRTSTPPLLLIGKEGMKLNCQLFRYQQPRRQQQCRALQRHPRHGHSLRSLPMDCESTGCTREATAFPGERSQRQESLRFCRDFAEIGRNQHPSSRE